MARPNRLSTKGPFNVIEKYGKYYLCYKEHELFTGERSKLYRIRTKYSSWFSIISQLIHSYGE